MPEAVAEKTLQVFVAGTPINEPVLIGLNETFIIVAKDQAASTGYGWYLTERPESVGERGPATIPSSMPGQPSYHFWALQPTQSGQFAIKMELKRPWEKEILESWQLNIHVE
jgi:predicted secreted protein